MLNLCAFLLVAICAFTNNYHLKDIFYIIVIFLEVSKKKKIKMEIGLSCYCECSSILTGTGLDMYGHELDVKLQSYVWRFNIVGGNSDHHSHMG